MRKRYHCHIIVASTAPINAKCTVISELCEPKDVTGNYSSDLNIEMASKPMRPSNKNTLLKVVILGTCAFDAREIPKRN